MAVLFPPVVLNNIAAAPNAVLLSAVLKRSAAAPVAVLKLPSVSLKSEIPANCCVRSTRGCDFEGPWFLLQ